MMLSLINDNLNDNTIKSLLENINRFEIKILDLERNNLTSSSILYLIEICRKLDQLYFLNISCIK